MRDCLSFGDSLDFGTGDVGMPIEKEIYLFNHTASTLEMTSSIEPPFSTRFPAKLLMAPGQMATVRIQFTAPDGRLHLGKFSYVGGPGCPQRFVELRGLGVGRLEVDTRTLDFGRVPFGVSKTLQLVLRNTRRDAVNVTVGAAPVFQMERQVVVAATGSLSIPVTVTPQVGDVLSGSIALTSSAHDEGRIEVRGEAGTPTIVVEPLHVSVAHVPLDGPIERKITLRNTSQATGNLELLEATDGGVLSGFTQGAVMGPSTTFDMPVQIQARALGPSTATLLVRSDDPQNPEHVVTIDFTGEQIFRCAMAMEAHPTSVISPTAMYPARLTFTFSNPTANDCLVDRLRPSISTWSLAAGETEQLIVPAMGSATRTVVIPGPGNGFLEWTTFKFAPVNQSVHIRLGL